MRIFMSSVLSCSKIPRMVSMTDKDRLARLASRRKRDSRDATMSLVLDLKFVTENLDLVTAKMRDRGVDMDLEARSLKSQMKQADRAGAAHVLIVGDQEMESGSGILRDMKTRDQVEVLLETTAVQEAIGYAAGK